MGTLLRAIDTLKDALQHEIAKLEKATKDTPTKGSRDNALRLGKEVAELTILLDVINGSGLIPYVAKLEIDTLGPVPINTILNSDAFQNEPPGNRLGVSVVPLQKKTLVANFTELSQSIDKMTHSLKILHEKTQVSPTLVNRADFEIVSALWGIEKALRVLNAELRLIETWPKYSGGDFDEDRQKSFTHLAGKFEETIRSNLRYLSRVMALSIHFTQVPGADIDNNECLALLKTFMESYRTALSVISTELRPVITSIHALDSEAAKKDKRVTLTEIYQKTAAFYYHPEKLVHPRSTLKNAIENVLQAIDGLNAASNNVANGYIELLKDLSIKAFLCGGHMVCPFNQGLDLNIGMSGGECYGVMMVFLSKSAKQEKNIFNVPDPDQPYKESLSQLSALSKIYPEMLNSFPLDPRIATSQKTQLKNIFRKKSLSVDEVKKLNNLKTHSQSGEYTVRSWGAVAKSAIKEISSRADKDKSKITTGTLFVSGDVGSHALPVVLNRDEQGAFKSIDFLDPNIGWFRFYSEEKFSEFLDDFMTRVYDKDFNRYEVSIFKPIKELSASSSANSNNNNTEKPVSSSSEFLSYSRLKKSYSTETLYPAPIAAALISSEATTSRHKGNETNPTYEERAYKKFINGPYYSSCNKVYMQSSEPGNEKKYMMMFKEREDSFSIPKTERVRLIEYQDNWNQPKRYHETPQTIEQHTLVAVYRKARLEFLLSICEKPDYKNSLKIVIKDFDGKILTDRGTWDNFRMAKYDRNWSFSLEPKDPSNSQQKALMKQVHQEYTEFSKDPSNSKAMTKEINGVKTTFMEQSHFKTTDQLKADHEELSRKMPVNKERFKY
jgi:hypothetical protein